MLDRQDDMALAIGIDLGTTYSAVAWVPPGGTPEIVPDEHGDELTPSVVSFVGQVPVVGAVAKADQARGELDVAAFFKSSMGDQAFIRRFADRDWTATDLSSLVLAHLKAQAELALGQPVTQAVVTVPEYFTHPQRTATIDAGRQAGLDVLRIISEPTAAALAYGMRPGTATGPRRVLVYDLGGGTFDVSLVSISEEEVRVIAAAGDHELGGRDWDDRLAMHVQELFRRDKGIDLLDSDPGELLVEVERLKRSLSARRTAEISVGAGGQSARYPVSRDEFETMSADLLERTANLTEQALNDAGFSWSDIDGVLPVGGSTRMPMVRDWVERMSGRPPMGGIHADQAVALGAALQAGLILDTLASAGGERPLLPGRRQVRDIVAHSLGMIAESADSSRYVNSVLLRRNTAIPCTTPRPYQFEVRDGSKDLLEVFLTQGETDDPGESTYLGRYIVTGFPAGVRGPVVVDISYTYDENAVVSVAATERGTGATLTVSVDTLPPDVPERFLQPPPRTAREPTTVYLAFDLSGSMCGEPLAAAQRAAEAFVSQVDLTTTSVGLIAFSDRVHTELKASQNAGAISRAIQGLVCCSTGGGNDADPFDEVHGLLHKRKGNRYAVVLADGVWYNQPAAVQRANRCHQDGIEVIAIGFGGADRAFLSQIASSTQQAFFTEMSKLTQAFSTIARELTESGGARSGAIREHSS